MPRLSSDDAFTTFAIEWEIVELGGGSLYWGVHCGGKEVRFVSFCMRPLVIRAVLPLLRSILQKARVPSSHFLCSVSTPSSKPPVPIPSTIFLEEIIPNLLGIQVQSRRE